MIWVYMRAKGVGEMTSIDGTMNACGYTKILADKMTPSLQELGRRGLFQQGNGPKHTAKSCKGVACKKKSVNYGLCTSPDLNRIEHLCPISMTVSMSVSMSV